MVAIAPFRAVRYHHADLTRVTSPPHDCITLAERDAFIAADPHNIVQVVLGPELATDGEGPGPPSRHARAAAFLNAWLADGTMRRDDRPAFYHYQVTHGPPDARRTMSGFFARVALDPQNQVIRPHEKTLKRKKRDRLRLREATGFDCEPIWLLYRDRRGWVEELLASNAFDELERFTDEAGEEHRLWRVDRQEAVLEIVAQFEDRTVVIADGHHRYQTALEHWEETGRPENGSILAGFVRDNDPGLSIQATHRLVQGTAFTTMAAGLQRAAKHWDATPIAQFTHAADLLGHFGADGRDVVLVGTAPEGLVAHLLTLRADSNLDGTRGRLDTLCVTRLHDRLLRDAWGLDPTHPEDYLRFARDAEEALTQLRGGECQFVILLPPEPVDAVLEVASEGQVMPQKATYFVPKLRSGLVLGPLDEPRPRPWQELGGDGGKAEWRMPRLP